MKLPKNWPLDLPKSDDARYERVACFACGQRWQRIDWGSALHRLRCEAAASPPPVQIVETDPAGSLADYLDAQRLDAADALDRAYAEAEAFDAARAASCSCGWRGPLAALEPLPEDAPEDDARVLLGACPKCWRAVYAPEPEGDTPEDWERIAGDRR